MLKASLRGGTADNPPPDVDLDEGTSLPGSSDIELDNELLLEVPDLFPFGTSPNLNFSLEP